MTEKRYDIRYYDIYGGYQVKYRQGKGRGSDRRVEHNRPWKHRKVKLQGEGPVSAKLVSIYLGKLLRYRMLDPISRKTVNSLGGPLQWWIQQKDLYPSLPLISRKYLAIPATSAASERLFSVAENTITDKRSRLTDDNAENIILQHSNQHLR